MGIEIRQTIVTPDPDGYLVQLHISDAAPDDEGATFRLVLLAKAPDCESPMVAHLQMAAIKEAHVILEILHANLRNELKRGGYMTEPRPRG
jgi:hypothetical protein